MLDRIHLLQQLRAARLPQSPISPVLQKRAGLGGHLLFFLALAAALVYVFASLGNDLRANGQWQQGLPLLVLSVALLIALGFEFINGFHDAANAVATVIYTNALPPNVAVLWSGLCNGLGVLLSSGAVAFAIVALLPLELMLQLRSGTGVAMIFALLLAAILWNLGTWWLGLPVSSSHTLIGSIIGVGLAHGLMDGRPGLQFDWHPLGHVGWALLLSPLVGLGGAAALIWLARLALQRRRPGLFEAPQGNTPPPWGIRALLILTCSGVSFAHGSNDGQKGMGLIMLTLIGAMPLVFAIDRDMPRDELAALQQQIAQSRVDLSRVVSVPPPLDPRAPLLDTTPTEREVPQLLAALLGLLEQTEARLAPAERIADLNGEDALALRDDLLLITQGIRHLDRLQTQLPLDVWSDLQALRSHSDALLQFVPGWVRIAVALALCLGTLVGWRRIVATVGEGIGSTRMTYAQGAAAQLTAMLTIGAADLYGMPVSTTQVLSSGVAGTMLASGSGLQWQTIRSMLLAWVLTLPAAIGLAGGLYWLFTRLF